MHNLLINTVLKFYNVVPRLRITQTYYYYFLLLLYYIIIISSFLQQFFLESICVGYNNFL